MINITDPSKCCGCTACASICTRDAINLEPDALGFLYPKVDKSKCIECGLCEKVCQFNDHYDQSLNLIPPIAYAARHKDIDEVMKSRSGAAFVAISDYIIEQGGVVYGVGYKDRFRVCHKRATTKEERDEFRGSKYVQSDLTGVFHQVKLDLKNGLTVLFSGTPCQTAGLNTFVGMKLRKNLLLLDVVCHGVPGPYLWRDHLSYMEKKQKDSILEVDFRNKKQFGWRAHRESYIFKNGGEKSPKYVFYKYNIFRHSCGVCHYTNTQRPSDITLADFWGCEKVVPDFNNDNKGINLILCNTERGYEMFETIKDRLLSVEVPLDKCIQPNLKHPTVPHPKREEFEKYYSIHGFESTMCHYGFIGWRYKLAQLKNKMKKKTESIKRIMMR